MEFKGLKIGVILAVIAFVIIIFLAGQQLYQFYNIEKPFQDKLQKLGYLESYQLEENNNGGTDLIVTWQAGINFYESYLELEKLAKESLGPSLGEIRILNTKDQELENLYYQLHYALYEGAATSQFIAMEEKISEITGENNLVDYKVWIDNQAIYLQLSENNHSFYQRIPLEIGGELNG